MKNPLTRAEVERIRDLVTIHPQVRDLANTALGLMDERDAARGDLFALPEALETTRDDLRTAEARVRDLEEGIRDLRIQGDPESGLNAEAVFVSDLLADSSISESVRLALNNWRGGIAYIKQVRALLTERADGKGGAE